MKTIKTTVRIKKPGAPAGNTGQAKLLKLKYSILKALQRSFLGAFWRLEQRIARVQDELANRGCANE
jgi:hypothetical protein